METDGIVSALLVPPIHRRTTVGLRSAPNSASLHQSLGGSSCKCSRRLPSNHNASIRRIMKLRSFAALCGFLIHGLCAAESNLTEPKSSQQILQRDFKPPQVFENVNLVRNTNLDKGYVRETINVVVANKDGKPQSDYYLPFEYDVMSKIGGIEVRDKKNFEKGKFEVEAASLSAVLSEDGLAVP